MSIIPYDALARSLRQSLERLPKIDLLQIHKANASNIGSNDVLRAVKMARAAGIPKFGASVSDLDTARIACELGIYEFLQFPFNTSFRASKQYSSCRSGMASERS